MASTEQVRKYLAYWLQLGKPVLSSRGKALLPQPVIQGDRYSPEFEQCWQEIFAHPSWYYLDGTEPTVDELLSSAWEVVACARCDMPVPILPVGTQVLSCPCFDMPLWPDTELPQPRSPIDTRNQLGSIRDRLLNTGKKTDLA
ncbi:MAG: hypothetical protein HC772_19315 [Leptolyngbyaceae cyanobacterium CRU_2_3]|nr:hypothetical protein [Leptolyngbyaceae cyanobacterium CRU_2_3]